MTTPKPLCFVLMPFGRKPGPGGAYIDFDQVYDALIRPAIAAAGLEPIRADEEQAGGVIHKPMFERLLLCEFAVADLTTANANVFYELGVRHAAKPRTTVLTFAEGLGQLPFDVGLLRGLPYALGPDGTPSKVDGDRAALTERLRAACEGLVDSPIYQLVEGYPEVAHEKTDVFRRQVDYAREMKERLRAVRAQKEGALDALRAIEAELGTLEDTESSVVVDLFLSYRAVKAWDEMIRLAHAMPRPLANTVMIREQLGLALNRAGRGEEAEQVLLRLIEERGPSSETYGILGRVYKDRWQAAKEAGQTFLAAGLLDQAIDAYTRGFEADWRDAYPGVNAVTLMDVRGADDPDEARMLPVVRYAVEQRVAHGVPDYWDFATLLELAVLANDQRAARDALSKALARVREVWEPETTARNLALIRAARAERGEDVAWIAEIEQGLVDNANER